MSNAPIDILTCVNRCQVAEMEKATPATTTCVEFFKHVRNVQASIINTFQVVAYEAVRVADPKDAARLWKQMSTICESALRVLRKLKDAFPNCGTPELYDLTLDYKSEADKRYYQNLQDSECTRTEAPTGLFPSTI
jgi:hypothetical protein